MVKLTTLVMTLGILSSSLPAQAQDRERGMWNSEFREQRAASVSPAPAKAAAPARAATPARPAPGLMLGITAWHLRPSRSTDRSRMLVHEGQSPTVELTPERIGADAQLGDGDRVRISVEAAAAGFLYVVSREAYGDKFGDPYLIFPSNRIRGGRASVVVGELVEVPEWNNPTPYLTIRKGRPDQTGEQILVLLSRQEIPGMQVTGSPLKLQQSLLEDWAKKWGGGVKMLDAPDQKGVALTPAEQDAASKATRLGPNDAVPQVLFRADAGGALLATYTLRLRP